MQLPYFYEPGIASGNTRFTLSKDTSRHCIQVLRMKAGEQLQLTDGKGTLYTAAISREDKKGAEVMLQHKEIQAQPNRKVCIAISLLKNATRFEWFLEKATEMGVQEIIPLLCVHTERQHFRYERMQGIVIAAMLQSRQCWLPLLHQPVRVQDAIQQSMYAQKRIAHCMDDAAKTPLATDATGTDVQIMIGPEGDFSAGEVALAVQHGYQPVSLGSTRLRTETAGVVASALLMYLH